MQREKNIWLLDSLVGEDVELRRHAHSECVRCLVVDHEANETEATYLVRVLQVITVRIARV